MPIGLGLASSHAPIITTPLEMWEPTYKRITKDVVDVPQPPEAALETAEVRASYMKRIEDSFETLRQQLADYKAELLVMIGGDQTELYDLSNVPQLMFVLSDVTWGHNPWRGVEPSEADIVRLKVDVETSKLLLHKLVTQEGFDVAFSSEQQALGQSKRGLAHAFTRPAPFLMPDLDIPTVVVYENTYHPPSLSAERCYEFGRALARLLKDDPRRIAIYGSGGLSHDPGGPRSGWIDKPLDRWFIDKLSTGKGRDVSAMYQFDSMTMRGGTGEMRSWITVAGAMEEMGAKAEVVDYIPAHHSVTGLGFAYWPTPQAVAAQ